MEFKQIHELIEAETKRFYTLKTKAARHKSQDRIQALRVQAADILDPIAKGLAGKRVVGTVRYADNLDGSLWIETEYGTIYANICNSVDSKSWYASTCCVEFTEGAEVSFTLTAETVFDRSALRLGAKDIFGGKLNNEKYKELCQRTDLAFFKYPDGHMSGLFKQA